MLANHKYEELPFLLQKKIAPSFLVNPFSSLINLNTSLPNFLEYFNTIKLNNPLIAKLCNHQNINLLVDYHDCFNHYNIQFSLNTLFKPHNGIYTHSIYEKIMEIIDQYNTTIFTDKNEAIMHRKERDQLVNFTNNIINNINNIDGTLHQSKQLLSKNNHISRFIRKFPKYAILITITNIDSLINCYNIYGQETNNLKNEFLAKLKLEQELDIFVNGKLNNSITSIINSISPKVLKI